MCLIEVTIILETATLDPELTKIQPDTFIQIDSVEPIRLTGKYFWPEVTWTALWRYGQKGVSVHKCNPFGFTQLRCETPATRDIYRSIFFNSSTVQMLLMAGSEAGNILTLDFGIQPAPEFMSLQPGKAPLSGYGGATLLGANFNLTNASQLVFGGRQVAKLLFKSSTQITFTIPSQPQPSDDEPALPPIDPNDPDPGPLDPEDPDHPDDPSPVDPGDGEAGDGGDPTGDPTQKRAARSPAVPDPGINPLEKTFEVNIRFSMNGLDFYTLPFNQTYYYVIAPPVAPTAPLAPIPVPAPVPVPLPVPAPEPVHIPTIWDWLLSNMWVPILIAVVLAIIVCVIVFVCCYKYECCSDDPHDDGYQSLSDLVGEIGLSQKAVIKASEIVFKKRVGRGSFADVYEATWQHATVAVKKLRQFDDEESINELIQEAKIMVQLRHPNVVSFLGICSVAPDLCIITEFVEKGSLFSILKNSDWILEHEHLRKMALDACYGISYLHETNLIHRDLKSKNLLVARDWTVKVADFGLSKFIEETKVEHTLTACGTPVFSAPEVLNHQKYTFSADVYSFGMVLFEMWVRQPPFHDLPPYQVIVSIVQKGAKPEIPASKDVPLSVIDLMNECLSYNPKDRPTIQQVIKSLTETVFPIPHTPYPTLKKGKGPRVSDDGSASTSSGEASYDLIEFPGDSA